MTNVQKEWAEFVEAGAALEHERWSGWHRHMRDKINPENMMRWDRQSDTPYADLSEQEKESDRKEVRQYLPLIEKLIASHNNSLVERLEGLKESETYPHNEIQLTDRDALIRNQALTEAQELIKNSLT